MTELGMEWTKHDQIIWSIDDKLEQRLDTRDVGGLNFENSSFIPVEVINQMHGLKDFAWKWWRVLKFLSLTEQL